jgi:hypothetical protein
MSVCMSYATDTSPSSCTTLTDNFEPFVKDVEDCVKLYAKIQKMKFEDVPLLLFFYHSIMDLFRDAMKEVFLLFDLLLDTLQYIS